MRINPYAYIDVLNNHNSFDPNVYKKAKLINRNRLIYLLNEKVPDDIISILGNRHPFKVILINYATSKQENGCILNTKSYYIFSTYCSPDELIKNFRNIKLNLSYVLTTGWESWFDAEYENEINYADLGTALADDFFSKTGPRSINFNDLYSDSVDAHSKDLALLDPRYYNTKHYELDTKKEFVEIPALNQFSFYGSDLIDDTTDIFVSQPNMNLEIINPVQIYAHNGNKTPVLITDQKVIWSSFEQQAAINNFPLTMFQINHESFFSSYILNYDTKYKGFKIDNIFNPKEYTSSNRRSDYIGYIHDMVEDQAIKMKAKFGDIRIMYYFSNIKEIITIEFDECEFSKMTYHFTPQDMLEKADTANFWYKFEDELINSIKYQAVNVNLKW